MKRVGSMWLVLFVFYNGSEAGIDCLDKWLEIVLSDLSKALDFSEHWWLDVLVLLENEQED